MRILLLAIAFCTSTLAAPIPKSMLKRRPGNPDGVWQIVEFWSHGNKGSTQGMVQIWEVEGEDFYVGRKMVNGQKQTPTALKIYDESNTNLRLFASNKAAIECIGDEFRFCYTDQAGSDVTECKPLPNVHYYVFERVK